MVAPVFGWSAGDIVQSIKIINKICDAFKESGHASTKYAESTAFLQGFKLILSHIKDYTNDSSTAKYTEAINEQVKLIDASYSHFEKHMLKFYPALGATSTQSGIQKAPKRIKWALKELSDVFGKVSELKKAVADPIVLIGPLLQLQSLDTIGAIATQISKLPDDSQFDTLKRALTDTVAVAVAEFEEHVRDLKQAADRQGEQIAVQSESLVSLSKCSPQKDIGTRSTVSEENEKNQQQGIAESTRMMVHIEGVIVALQEKLDIIISTLADQCDLQLRPLKELEECIKTQQITLNQVQNLAEAFFAKVVDLIAILEITRNKANPERMQRNDTWLGQFANQLLASGITSAMTGAVVFIATRSKSISSEKSNDYVEWSREQSSTTVSREKTRSTNAEILGPNEERISKIGSKTHSTSKEIEGRTMTSSYSSQPVPKMNQNGGMSNGLNVEKNEVSAFKNAGNKPSSISRETAIAETSQWTRLTSSLSFATKSDAQMSQADSKEKSVTGSQGASSRSNARISVNLSRQSPANQILIVPGLEDDKCVPESRSMRSQTSTSGPETSAPVKSIQKGFSNSLNDSKQQVASKKRKIIIKNTADHQSSTLGHSDYSQSSLNNKTVSGALAQNHTSEGSSSAYGENIWICCSCLSPNLGIVWPERCGTCGHHRCGDCYFGAKQNPLLSTNPHLHISTSYFTPSTSQHPTTIPTLPYYCEDA